MDTKDMNKHNLDNDPDVKHFDPKKPRSTSRCGVAAVLAFILVLFAFTTIFVTLYFTVLYKRTPGGTEYIGPPETATEQPPDAATYQPDITATPTKFVLEEGTTDLDKNPWISVQLTFENMHGDNNTLHFSITRTVDVQAQTSVYEIMKTIAEINSYFMFEFKEYSGLGRYVFSIQGVEADPSQQTFWALMMRDGQGQDCLVDEGIDLLMPSDGEHIVFSLKTYGVFDVVPSCASQGEALGTNAPPL